MCACTYTYVDLAYIILYIVATRMTLHHSQLKLIKQHDNITLNYSQIKF